VLSEHTAITRRRDEGAGGKRERGRRERATTLSMETTGQRVDSVHLAERLCSFFLLNP
jgi:hypothetical protein